MQNESVSTIVEKLDQTIEVLVYETSTGKQAFNEKSSQSDDIEKAKEYLEDYRGRYGSKKTKS